LTASPGVASGKAKYIKDKSELDRIEEGDILVTIMTNPDMVPAMRKANAVVTEEGGRTCHAAIVSRELGIPCIVGAKGATTALKEGMDVTVDAIRGVVYEGIVLQEKKEEKQAQTAGQQGMVQFSTENLEYKLAPITATKLYMNLGEPALIVNIKN